MIDPATFRAYLETAYNVAATPPLTLLIGKQNSLLATLHATTKVESSAFITACAPFSQPLDDASNAARQTSLKQDLAVLSTYIIDGIGEHPTNGWKEPSFLALGLSLDTAKALGKKYQQNAIVWAGQDATPQLILLR